MTKRLIASVNQERGDFAIANYKDKVIYITGGELEIGLTKSVLTFCLDQHIFLTNTAPMKLARMQHSSASIGNIVAVFGGFTNSGK